MTKSKARRILLAAGVAAAPAAVVASPALTTSAEAGGTYACWTAGPPVLVYGFAIASENCDPTYTPPHSGYGYARMQVVFNGQWKTVGPQVTTSDGGSPPHWHPYVQCFSGTWKYRGVSIDSYYGPDNVVTYSQGAFLTC